MSQSRTREGPRRAAIQGQAKPVFSEPESDPRNRDSPTILPEPRIDECSGGSRRDRRQGRCSGQRPRLGSQSVKRGPIHGLAPRYLGPNAATGPDRLKRGAGGARTEATGSGEAKRKKQTDQEAKRKAPRRQGKHVHFIFRHMCFKVAVRVTVKRSTCGARLRRPVPG
jgi:hypothetical protein